LVTVVLAGTDIIVMLMLGLLVLFHMTMIPYRPEDIPRSVCLIPVAPYFAEFRQKVADDWRSVVDKVRSLQAVESSAAEYFGSLAVAGRFTPGGFVYIDPDAFVARFGKRFSYGVKDCDFIAAVADGRNWRPGTAADAARRRAIHDAGKAAR
jgi:hypothetical protein